MFTDLNQKIRNHFKVQTALDGEKYCKVKNNVISFDLRVLSEDEVKSLTTIYTRLVEKEKEELAKEKLEDLLKGLK